MNFLVVLLISCLVIFVSGGSLTQVLDCGIGGKQNMDLFTSFKSPVGSGSTWLIDIRGDNAKPGVVTGSNIKNLAWYFTIPSGVTAVGVPVISYSGGIVSGSGTLGSVAVSATGSVIKMTASGTINDGATFVPPGFSMNFTSTAAGTTKNFVSQSNPAYSLTAVISVTCSVYGSSTNWASVQIV